MQHCLNHRSLSLENLAELGGLAKFYRSSRLEVLELFGYGFLICSAWAVLKWFLMHGLCESTGFS